MKIMEQVFMTVLNMSAAASVVIAVVLLARLLLRRAPKKWSYLLWSVVAFRLCCPVSFKSIFSVFRLKVLQPSAASAAAETAARQTSTITYIPQLTPQTPAVSPVTTPVTPTAPITPVTPVTPVSPSVPVTTPVTTPAAAEMAQSTPTLLTTLLWMMIWLWIAAMLVLIGYSIYSYIKMRRVVDDAVIVRDNIYETDRIRTPFILGLVRPRIYIPTGLDSEQMDYVVAHESCHLRRHDNIVKTFAFLLMAVHWFNPLVWLSFHLMTKDMEMSCDEAVLGRREGANKTYSTTLLSFAAPSHFPAATPLCFGESSVKSRIKNALSWRRPRTWVTLLAILLCVAALAACATNPATPKAEPEPISQEQEEPDEELASRYLKMKVGDVGHDAFHIQLADDYTMALTVQLPESWMDRYTVESDDYGFSVFDRSARADAPEGSTWGLLFSIRCLPGMYPLNFEWGYKAKVLATNADATFLMEYPDEIQSAEMVHSSESVTKRYMEMRGETDQVQVILSGDMQEKTYNEYNWDPDTVTLYQSVKVLRGGQPVFCDGATSRAIREMLTGRKYVGNDTVRRSFENANAVGVLADTVYAVDMRTGAILQYDVGLVAAEPLTADELAQLRDALECRGYGWQVRVTDLGSNSFRIEDAGYTPGLDMTVQLPASWAGRYAYDVYSGGITFYCKATRESSNVDGYPGVLCGIDVVDRMMTPDEPLPDSSRVLATAGSYSVLLIFPSDIQFGEDTMAEYQAMSEDRDQIKIKLSDWMLTNTWNETNWVPGTVTLRDYDQDSKTVICDALTSQAIREMLESRTFEENDTRMKTITSHGLEIQCNGRLYYLVGTPSRDPWISGYVMNDTAQFNTEPLTDSELSYLQRALNNNGRVLQVKVTDQGGDTFRLEDVGYTPGLDMTVKVPASWAGRYDYRITETGITLYCKAAHEGNEDYVGRICWVDVQQGVYPLDYTLNYDQVLASGQNYSVWLRRPTDWACPAEAAEEYEKMGGEIDSMTFTLSPEMERNTWNESNWVPGTVTVVWKNQEGWNPVICDPVASAAIRQFLNSREYVDNTIGSYDSVIFVDGVKYFFHSETGTLYSAPGEGYTKKAKWPLQAGELALIRTAVENGGTLPVYYEDTGSHYTIHGYDAAMLGWQAETKSLYFADPAFWGEKFAGVGVEGGAHWNDDGETELSMGFVVSNGQTSTGAMEGLHVNCTVNVSTGTVVSREFTSDGGDTLELTDQDLVEIAVRTAQVMRDAEANVPRG